MNRMKKVVAIMVALLLIILQPLTVYASAIMPRYVYIDNITARFEIDTTWGIASCEGSVAAKDDLPVEVIVKLQKRVNGQWETLKTWSVEDSWGAYASGHYAIDRGYDYRIYVVGYVYDSAGNVIDGATLAKEQYY